MQIKKNVIVEPIDGLEFALTRNKPHKTLGTKENIIQNIWLFSRISGVSRIKFRKTGPNKEEIVRRNTMKTIEIFNVFMNRKDPFAIACRAKSGR